MQATYLIFIFFERSYDIEKWGRDLGSPSAKESRIHHGMIRLYTGMYLRLLILLAWSFVVVFLHLLRSVQLSSTLHFRHETEAMLSHRGLLGSDTICGPGGLDFL